MYNNIIVWEITILLFNANNYLQEHPVISLKSDQIA